MQRRSNKKYKYIGVGIIVIAFVFIGIFQGGLFHLTGSKKVTIAQAGDFFLYAPLYIAIDNNFFKEEGLDVTITTTGGDEKTWAAVISKSADFGISDPTFVAIADSRGASGQVVGCIVNGVPFWGITFNDSINFIKEGKALAGYTVATFPSPSTAYTLQRKMFVDAGLQPKIREGAFGTLASMLRAGQADIALELEPNVSQLSSEGGKVLYSLGGMYGDFAITGIMTTKTYLVENEDTTQKVLNALQKSLCFINAEPEKTIQILQKRFPEVKPEVARAALGRVLKDNILPKSLVMKKDAWDKAIQLRIDAGDITEMKNAEYFINNKYSQKSESLFPAK